MISSLQVACGACCGQIAIIKTWNGAVGDGKKAVIAARTAGGIERCVWTKVVDAGDDTLVYE